ncbi:Na+:H+ antiporter, NhaA family [Chryseolinea serpens]|uniref:Na(+)/H(+) antiporter NhaA n=1 Tax=Chryseolinea serpens TaxID=947013 RepID=A0A1M5MKS2_9BACT|nr:Na+/H+ antiporter NhaA [Chryseolinea serpens]SHG77846.1 Na+:H+ antiporter, NhaA family [Chryseolinea serpens]
MKVTHLFEDFFHSEKAAGLVLMACTILSLLLANSGASAGYLHFWHLEFSGHSVSHWINDGLMAIFFLLVGLELEREVYIGELSSLKNALLPVVAALGGMLVPAGFHFLFNRGTDTQAGAGIPMATDIAFALAALSLLGKRVPNSLKIFLTALAVIDDLGAILVIAIFYTGSVAWMNLIAALSVYGALLLLNRLKVRNLIPYLIGGAVMWYFMLHSGIHATIAGVLTAFAIPFGNGDEKSTSFILQRFLHRPIAFGVLPLFALANTAVVLPNDWVHSLVEANSLGIFTGLFLGKPLGIFVFSLGSSLIGITRLPSDLKWTHILGTGFLGGIGFTMSIFITFLAFNKDAIIDQSKIVILISSLLAGVAGFFLLNIWVKPETVGVDSTRTPSTQYDND